MYIGKILIYTYYVILAKWAYAGGDDQGAGAGGFILDDDGTGAPPVGVANVSPRNAGMVNVAAAGGMNLGAGDQGERFSRKVFVGGLPPDIDEGMEEVGSTRMLCT